MRKRLKALTTVRRLMRRQFFFYRMRRRIATKRKATATLIDYLQSLQGVPRPQMLIRRYAHAVRRIQANWRRSWLVISTQLHVIRERWIEAEVERGLSRSAAAMVETRERELRMDVIRDDLRERKAAHLSEMLKYRRARREYDEWYEQQRILEEARLIAGGKSVGGERLSEQEKYELPSYKLPKLKDSAKASADGAEVRQPPRRPHFNIAPAASSFLQLAERVRKLKDVEQRAKDREWAEHDKLFMQKHGEGDSGSASPMGRRKSIV